MKIWLGLPRLARLAPLALLLLTSCATTHHGSGPTSLQLKVYDRLDNAAEVLRESLTAGDGNIPQGLLDKSDCVIVIPSMKKAGLGIGGRYGRGAVTCRRTEASGGWGPPVMLSLHGGSIGFQIGVAAIDVVMLVFNRRGVESLLYDKFTLGIDGTVAVGPVGRSGTAETDAFMEAKILTYSRSKGLYAGIELKGAVIKEDGNATRALYGDHVESEELLAGIGAIPIQVEPFLHQLEKHSPIHINDRR